MKLRSGVKCSNFTRAGAFGLVNISIGAKKPSAHSPSHSLSAFSRNKIRVSQRALVALLSINATVVSADSQMSWEQLREHCDSPQPPQQALCEGYILGASDAGNLCIPASIKPATLQDLALSINTDSAEPPARAIIERLREVFPCAGEGRQATADAGDNAAESAASKRSPNWSNKTRIGK